MSAIDKQFAQLRSAGPQGLYALHHGGRSRSGFHRRGYPRTRRPGRNLCELGIPYSDPIADGPVIQASYTRALDKKIKLAGIL